MITIRKLNFLTDCYRDFAGDIQAILDELYEVSPWTFEQTFADLLREETVYYLAFSEDQKVLGFLALSVVMDEIEITNIAVAKAYQSVFIEVKTPKGRPTEKQQKFIQMMKLNGAVAGVCRSADEAIKLILEE